MDSLAAVVDTALWNQWYVDSPIASQHCVHWWMDTHASKYTTVHMSTGEGEEKRVRNYPHYRKLETVCKPLFCLLLCWTAD